MEEGDFKLVVGHLNIQYKLKYIQGYLLLYSHLRDHKKRALTFVIISFWIEN